MSWNLDSLFDPFASDRLDQPPSGLLAYYWRYVGQAWPWFAAVAVTGGILSIIGAAMYAYVGIVVDRIEGAESPAAFFEENLWLLIWIGALVLIIEPLTLLIHMLLYNQLLAPATTSLVRWQSHRYLLRQSMAFFQNDFAGRIAQKVIQTSFALRRSVGEMIDAVWYVTIFWVSALFILADLDWRIAVPTLVWLAAYAGVLRFMIPRVQAAATEASESNSALTGRIVDSYTNIQTVKLFGHAHREDAYALTGIRDYHTKFRTLMREISYFETSITVLNGMLWSSTARWCCGCGLSAG